jgi:hypothetical protein
MSVEINYWSSAADEMFPLSLRVAADGAATLTVQSNRDNPGVNHAGVYRATLRPQAVEPLVAALRGSDFAALPAPAQIYPGEVVRRLSFKEPGRVEVVKYVHEGAPAPAAFLNAERFALDLIKEVRRQPVYALEIGAGGWPARLARGEQLQGEVTLANFGAQPIQIHHADAWGEGAVEFELTGLRSDVPLADLRSHHQRFERVTKGNLKAYQAANAQAPWVKLAPTERVRLGLAVALDWPPGRYDVRLTYQCSIFSQDGREQARVELNLPPFSLTVAGEARPEDNKGL